MRRIIFLVLFLAGCDPRPAPAPYTPDDALSTFQLEDGFTIELVAAEPLIADPVAMEIDEYGRLYVVEMPGYPLDVSGTGRVKRLDDTDGDGRMDEVTVFADNLTLPTGLMRWKNGLLVTDAPDVLYLEDTDGDGTADHREVVLTGFARSNPQHNFNKPLYGLDNWIYLANNNPIWTETFTDLFGDRGSEIHFPAQPDVEGLGQNAFDRNVRFRPDTYEIETLSGDSQFGHTFDAWGHHFLVDNSHPQYHEVLAARYLRRNPDLPVRRAMQYTPAYGLGAEVYPITENPEHQLLTDQGVFTSAAGITYYLGGLFSEPYENVTFVAEPVHNLVHVDQVTDNGATFTADRLLEGREFLASRDSWFRPVNFYVGPDGALYVVDYYRQIVEHPQWMDDAVAASGDLQNGTQSGRIYRITPNGTPAATWSNALTLGEASTDELVEHLADPNIWWRRHAQRLLVERKPEDAVEPLTQLAIESPSALGRLHALWTLDGLDRLEPALIRQALNDSEPGVRENAIRLAESYVDKEPGLVQDLIALRDDPNPKVRFQLLNTLGDFDTPEVRAVREALLFRDLEDEWTQIAALAVSPEQGRPAFRPTLARLQGRETPGRQAYLRRVTTLIGSEGQSDEVEPILQAVTSTSQTNTTWWRVACLNGLADGLRFNRPAHEALRSAQEPLLQTLFDLDGQVRRAALDLFAVTGLPESPSRAEVVVTATQISADAEADPMERVAALRLLALDDPTAHEERFAAVLESGVPAPVQRAALEGLGQIDGLEAARVVLAAWPVLTPAVRSEAVDVFLEEEPRVTLLLDALESGEVLVSTVGWNRRVRLMRDFDGEIRDRARALLRESPEVQAERAERYLAALSEQGDAEQGRAVFETVCATCHQISGEHGAAFGPDLATVRHWPEKALLNKILDPNRSITDGYELWLIERKSGGTVAGVIAEETPTALTLRQQGGVETVVPRTDIAQITPGPGSPMPTGLEAQISEQDMVDLIAFIKNADFGVRSAD